MPTKGPTKGETMLSATPSSRVQVQVFTRNRNSRVTVRPSSTVAGITTPDVSNFGLNFSPEISFPSARDIEMRIDARRIVWNNLFVSRKIIQQTKREKKKLDRAVHPRLYLFNRWYRIFSIEVQNDLRFFLFFLFTLSPQSANKIFLREDISIFLHARWMQ